MRNSTPPDPVPYSEGPWEIEPDEASGCRGLVISSPTGIICVLDCELTENGHADDPQAWADARLIASAPCLLAALEEMMAISDRKHNAWDKARVAIAKAKGFASNI